MAEASDDYQLGVLSALAGVGIMVQYFFGSETTPDGSSGPATAVVWGYGLSSIALVLLLFVSFALTTDVSRKISMSGPAFLSALFSQAIPIVCLLAVLAWILTLNLRYYTRINKGLVANEYEPYSRISMFMIAMQLILIVRWAGQEAAAAGRGGRNKTAKELANADQVKYIGYLLTVINIVFAGMLTIVLTYFTTDG